MIRRFEASDAAEVAALIGKTMHISNSKDYPEDYITQGIALFTPEYVKQRAGWTHFYVVCEGEKIIGCGAIGPYWDKTDESCLFTIFVLPNTRAGAMVVSLLKHLNRMNSSSVQNALRFLPPSPAVHFIVDSDTISRTVLPKLMRRGTTGWKNSVIQIRLTDNTKNISYCLQKAMQEMFFFYAKPDKSLFG